jgi:hypothetical protein
MKMVAHQAEGKGIADREDVLLIKLHEEPVVAFFKEDILPIVAPVVDMVITPGFEWNIGLHDHSW